MKIKIIIYCTDCFIFTVCNTTVRQRQVCQLVSLKLRYGSCGYYFRNQDGKNIHPAFAKTSSVLVHHFPVFKRSIRLPLQPLTL
ncbi:MAG: hypothetical protein H0A76_13480 [Candidatus Thiodubiliella endoseptemdiera]|uniref:Uncharacterized protein n=1 Tax=Candidatus Thiodubiliella endoseptemdiera TaxID=2738886 RepID=A0A853F8E6_9GAMM|nr:hypothetical protein [Candidatus Thiodubiliella endoseptemdiera]